MKDQAVARMVVATWWQYSFVVATDPFLKQSKKKNRDRVSLCQSKAWLAIFRNTDPVVS